MFIYGADCSLTLVRGAEETALPYTLETLREERTEVPLDPLVGYMMPIVHVPAGYADAKVLGCAVTRICQNTVYALARLMVDGYRFPFSLHLNRIVEKRIYRNLLVYGWELRGSRDEAISLRFNVEGKEAEDWSSTTENRAWEESGTLEFRDGDISISGIPSSTIHRFSLTRIYGNAISTILQIHYPLTQDDPLNNAFTLDAVVLQFGEKLRVTLQDCALLSFNAKTDNAEEILVVRRFRVNGDCRIDVKSDAGVWESPA